MRTVVIPFRPPPSLLRALYDVRSMVNRLVIEWRHRPDLSRFAATKRSYPALRSVYAHLGSKWAVVGCNETSATLNSWDRMLRRARGHDLARFDRMRSRLPHRAHLKASLHPAQYRLKGRGLDITIHPSRHVTVDLSQVRNPLFERYLGESNGKFGLSVTDHRLLFHFYTPTEASRAKESVGIDLNMSSLDYARLDGQIGSVDLRPISRVQGAMARKRISIHRAISKDVRHQRAVLRRYGRRERNRAIPLLHEAANPLLNAVGDRNIVLEDLNATTDELLRERGSSERRRRLAAWSHGHLQRIMSYKARTAVVRVNPRGTSSECPRCGGPLAHPTWRRATCENCKGDFHRDRMAAVAILSRGQSILWGAALPPNALNELLEAARWRPDDENRPDPAGEPKKGDEA
ncbi:MAG: transposase [Thermoplasmata archaeon]|nr:transposase [Thermoplasmata archaeon]